jgi:hypothetical protein
LLRVFLAINPHETVALILIAYLLALITHQIVEQTPMPIINQNKGADTF